MQYIRHSGSRSKVRMTESEESYLTGEEFPILDGERMCPRCMCCSAGVGGYDPPPMPEIGVSQRAIEGLLVIYGHLPLSSSLVREPSPDPSSGPEAWYCRGGCDEKGMHSKGWPQDIPTFIARVRKSEFPRSGG